jgi:high-affinity nickel permease
MILTGLSMMGLGFLLGVRHAADADHVVAVTTIVSRERTVRAAAWIGALWGVGHTLTIMIVGGAIILFNWVVPPRVALSMEFTVGLMLILLGTLNVTGVMNSIKTSAAKLRDRADRVAFNRYDVIRPLVVGIVHGLAGSATVALLVLTTIRDPQWGMAYLLVFGVGTVGGMVLITTTIAAPFALGTRRFAGSHRRLQVITGLVSVAFGLLIAYQIGFVDGLFPVPFQ